MRLLAYKARADAAPLLVNSLQDLARRNERAAAGILASLDRLAVEGHRIRRPAAAPLGGGLFELRTRRGGVHMRILFTFVGKETILITHAFQKDRGAVPRSELARARRYVENYLVRPSAHGHALE